MSIGEVCNREVIVMRRDESVLEAARLMREFHVGAIVVVDELNGKRWPVGVVTDRDLVMEVLVNRLDPESVSVGEILSESVVSVQETSSVFDALQHMRGRGVRRAPVAGMDGELVGIITVDDLIALFAEEMTEVYRLIRREQQREAESRQGGAAAGRKAEMQRRER